MHVTQTDTIKAVYLPGTKIMLISKHDGARLQRPENGQVSFVDELGLVHVRLNSGAEETLNCMVDKFIMLSHFAAKEYLEQIMYLPENGGILYAEEYDGDSVAISAVQMIELAQHYANRNIELTSGLAMKLHMPYDMSVVYDSFISEHIVNLHELRHDNPYVEIKNLAQFKQFVRTGGKLKVVKNTMRPELEGIIIIAKSVFTNHIYYVAFNEPDHPLHKVNLGQGMRMDFGKAADYYFGNDSIIRHIQNKSKDQIEWVALPEWYLK